MAQQASLVKEGVDRLNDTFRSIDDEFQKVQKQVNQRRRTIEKRLRSERKTFEKRLRSERQGFERRTRKEVKRIQTELRKNPMFKRAESLRKDVRKQVETRIDEVLEVFRIASKSDMQRIDRKINSIGRRLKEVEKTGQSAA